MQMIYLPQIARVTSVGEFNQYALAKRTKLLQNFFVTNLPVSNMKFVGGTQNITGDDVL